MSIISRPDVSLMAASKFIAFVSKRRREAACRQTSLSSKLFWLGNTSWMGLPASSLSP